MSYYPFVLITQVFPCCIALLLISWGFLSATRIWPCICSTDIAAVGFIRSLNSTLWRLKKDLQSHPETVGPFENAVYFSVSYSLEHIDFVKQWRLLNIWSHFLRLGQTWFDSRFISHLCWSSSMNQSNASILWVSTIDDCTSVADVFIIHQVAPSVHQRIMKRSALPVLMGRVICIFRILTGMVYFSKA